MGADNTYGETNFNPSLPQKLCEFLKEPCNCQSGNHCARFQKHDEEKKKQMIEDFESKINELKEILCV